MANKTLIIEFGGACMIRQPTDPDPYDEVRGVSGYTFAFGDEPDLNRVIYFHEHPDFPRRSHCPPFGVFVTEAFAEDLSGRTPLPVLEGARFDLLGDPVLENRNWNLTRPGYEPIVPFHIDIASPCGGARLNRLDVLAPDHPDTPVWKLPLADIERKGARGLSHEPQTVGSVTGCYEGYLIQKRRYPLLEADLKRVEAEGVPNDPRIAVLQGRMNELGVSIADYEAGTPNRRSGVYLTIERFGYDISGNPGVVEGDFGGPLAASPASPWRIDYWIGGWDFDALCATIKGTLQIPYAEA